MAEFLRTRKRSREDDLPCESAPLSKRINNLHLNYDDGNSSSSSSCSIPTQINDYNNYNSVPVIAGGPAAAATAAATPSAAAAAAAAVGAANAIDILNGEDRAIYGYNPELSADQNPYYYDKNKMLYDLHVERVKRNTH